MASAAGKRRRTAPTRLGEDEPMVDKQQLGRKKQKSGAGTSGRGRARAKKTQPEKSKEESVRVDEDERDGEKAEGGHTSREEEREEMLTEEQTGEEEQNKLREKQEERGERQEKQYAGQEREEPEGQVAAEEKKEEKPKREQLAGEDKSREEEGKTEKGSSKAEHAAKKDQGENNRFLEKGLIYFFYRPKVGVEEVHDLEHVQRLYLVLIPKETVKVEDLEHRKHRVMVITRKKMPDVHLHARYWGFVEETSDEMKELRSDLGAVTYTTKTRGERRVEAARPAGRGFYGVITHRNHTHLAYVLELPEKIGEVQEAFNIQKEGSYIITVKNPEVRGPMGLLPREKEPLPDHLLHHFQGRKFVPLDPPSFLDYKGTEVIIIGASDDLKAGST